jgi:hypothetical protein
MRVSSSIFVFGLLGSSSCAQATDIVRGSRSAQKDPHRRLDQSSDKKGKKVGRQADPMFKLPTGCPCKGQSYIIHVLGLMDYFEALNNPPKGCYLAPPKEVQDTYPYLKRMFGYLDYLGDSWVGAWKDPTLVMARDGTLLPADGVEGWATSDGSPWHVTIGDPDGYWLFGEPTNQDFNNSPENVVGLDVNGQMVDRATNTKFPGAFYKCCYDICDDPGGKCYD